jgi:capsular exopolysaccharide synthesis family protein
MQNLSTAAPAFIPQAPNANVAPQVSDVDFRLLLRLFWRRRLFIAGCILSAFCLMLLALMFIQPRYTARTAILIDTAMPQGWPAEFDALAGGMKYDTAVLMSEIEILKSRNLARQVFANLGLEDDPYFAVYPALTVQDENPQYVPEIAPEPQQGQLQQGFKTLTLNRAALPPEPSQAGDPSNAQEQEFMISRFLEGLSVRNVPGSFVLQIEYTAPDPARAATIANGFAAHYITQGMQDRSQSSRRIRDWLDSRLSELRMQVLKSQQDVQQFRAQHGMMEGVQSLVSTEQLSELNAALVQARAQKAEAAARLAQVRGLKIDSGIDNVPAALGSAVIERLRLEQLALQSRLAELSLRYGEKHPVMIQTKSDLLEARQALAQELQKLVGAIESEHRAAEARVQALETGLQEAGRSQFQDQAAWVQLDALEREAETSRIVFNSFLETYKRGDDQELLHQPQVKIISPAAIPHDPVYPRRNMMLALAGLIGLFAGLAIVIVLEKFDNSFKSPNQLEQALGYACFALIPKVERASRIDVAKYILGHPSSNVAEAVRTLRMILNLRARNQAGEKPRVVTLTSSFPGEGKTTLSSWMGRVAAKSGERVIVIDADLRRPSLHRAMGQKNDETLVDFLTGQMDLDRVIKKDPDSGLHMIFARAVPHTALDLLGGARMKTLIESLRQVYDLVIIDSPACLAVSDARILASLSDQVLYAVSWDETPREVVYSGVKQFTDFGYKNLAFVLTKVDVKRHVSYGYGEAAYYNRAY